MHISINDEYVRRLELTCLSQKADIDRLQNRVSHLGAELASHLPPSEAAVEEGLELAASIAEWTKYWARHGGTSETGFTGVHHG